MNQLMPLVTVIIPVYNVEKYLKTCIESVIGQSYQNMEIILVDDGSLDSSGSICDQYKVNDDRIKVIHKINGGLSDARNAALDVCTGEYISFVDSDDYISPIFIDTVIQALLKGNCDIIALKCGKGFWDDGNSYPMLADRIDDCQVEYLSADIVLKKMLYQQIAIGAPFKICRRELFEDVRFPYGYLYEDVATTYKLFLKASRAAIIYGDLYAYRMRPDSIIRQKFCKKKLIAKNIFEQLINDEELINAGLKKAVCSRVYAMLYSVFLQIPEEEIDIQKKVWKELKTVQKTVMFDSSKLMRKKNKYAAWVSLLGMRASYRIGKRFGQKGSMN